MTQKCIFITGAASGIGLATARIFAERGWRVGLCDRDAAGLAPLAAELGASASVHAADVTDASALQQAIAGFSGGPDAPLDALFNCAGLVEMRRFDETPLSRLHAIVDVNINGVINGMHGGLANLRAATNARIVTMCSTSAIYGVPDLAVYSSTKFAVRALTEALNIEFQQYGIWVTDVLVSFVRTPMVVDAEHKARSVDILGIKVEPEQVAETVLAAVTGERRVHWFVTETDAAYAHMVDVAPWEERHMIARSITGY